MEQSPWYRLALSILLTIVIASLWWTRFDELAYHTWESHELINLGDAKNFAEKIHEHKHKILANSYVSVSGILSPKAATLKGLRTGSFRVGTYQVRQLLGSKLYIEYLEDKYHKLFSPFTRVNIKGRLVSFGPDSELVKVREFFKTYYKSPVDDQAMLIVVDEEPGSEIIYILLIILSLGIIIISFYFSAQSFRRKKTDLESQD